MTCELGTLPPWIFVRWFYTKSYCLKVYVLRGQFLTKKLSVPGGNFSNYFTKIVVFSQLYRSKSATLEIAYDMKIDFLLCNLYFPLKQQSAKTIRTYIQILSDLTLNESVWTEINCSQWYDLKLMWNRNRAYLQPKNCLMVCLRTYIAQSRICPGNKKPMKYDVFRIII